MSSGRLPTEIWLMAGLRRCSAEGIPATVVRRGEKQSGTVQLISSGVAELGDIADHLKSSIREHHLSESAEESRSMGGRG